MERDALDIANVYQRAGTHGGIGLYQLIGQAARARWCDCKLRSRELGAVIGFPGCGRSVVAAHGLAGAIFQHRIGTDEDPFGLARCVGLVPALLGDVATANSFPGNLVTGGNLDGSRQ